MKNKSPSVNELSKIELFVHKNNATHINPKSKGSAHQKKKKNDPTKQIKATQMERSGEEKKF